LWEFGLVPSVHVRFADLAAAETGALGWQRHVVGFVDPRGNTTVGIVIRKVPDDSGDGGNRHANRHVVISTTRDSFSPRFTVVGLDRNNLQHRNGNLHERRRTGKHTFSHHVGRRKSWMEY
jgi:hypothetical protein